MNIVFGDTAGQKTGRERGGTDMDDLRRIRYVTEHYEQLQGLRLLPLGVPFLLSSLWRLTHPALEPFLSASGWALLLASAFVLSALIGRYYARHFGQAHPLRWRTVLPLVAVTAAFFWLEWLQELRPLPVPLPVLFVAVVLARIGMAAGWLRSHYLFIAAACAMFALLPLLGVPLEIRAAALDGLIGGGLAVAAIGDDRVLRRVMTMRSAS
jgi:hypothetical protein